MASPPLHFINWRVFNHQGADRVLQNGRLRLVSGDARGERVLANDPPVVLPAHFE